MGYEASQATQPHCTTLFIPPEADALAFPHAGSAATSSWLGFGSLLSTCELRNHFRSDPVQVQSTAIPCRMCVPARTSACRAMPDTVSGRFMPVSASLARFHILAPVCIHLICWQ